MKQVLATLGSALTAFGFSGWHAVGHTTFTLSEEKGQNWELLAGWPLHSQIEIALGITLLAYVLSSIACAARN
jgi:hypothetical protein